MLSSGAHVKIGTQEARLAFDIDGAYSYALDTTGEEVLFWLWEDWSGGEGNDAFDTSDEIVYHQGLVNPRRPGRLTSPPTRASNPTTGTLSPVPNIALSVVSGSTLTLIGEQVTAGATSYWYTTAPATAYTEQADSGWNTAIDRITAACGDGAHIYIAGMDNATSGFQIRQIRAATGSRSAADIRAYSGSDDVGRIIGMYVLGEYLYYWNGVTLFYRKIDTTATGVTATNEKVAKATGFSLTGLTYGTSYWGGMTGGDGSAYFFNATDGKSTVYEVSITSAVNEIWNMPSGFTAKSITYQSGAILLVGEYLNNAALFGMSVVSRQPIFLGFIRYGQTVSPEVIAAGYGSEVIIAEKSTAAPAGEVFIYDISQDAFSQLDDITHTSGSIWSAGTWQGNRYVAYEDGEDLGIYYWSDDDTPSTSVDGRMESGAWTFDLPEDEKQLDGIHILSDAGGGKSVDVYYQDNEDGVWTLAGTASSGFHNYITVSDANSTVKFRSLRLRVDPKAGATVYSVSARCRVNTYEERWELLLDLSDEVIDGPPQNRRRSNQDRGWQLRDYIRDIADNKTVVTFLDGAKYPQDNGDDPDKYTSHAVIVDIPVDRVERPGEGTMLVRLRSVAVN